MDGQTLAVAHHFVTFSGCMYSTWHITRAIRCKRTSSPGRGISQTVSFPGTTPRSRIPQLASKAIPSFASPEFQQGVGDVLAEIRQWQEQRPTRAAESPRALLCLRCPGLREHTCPDYWLPGPTSLRICAVRSPHTNASHPSVPTASTRVRPNIGQKQTVMAWVGGETVEAEWASWK
jgi:hypothetical protein